MLRVAQIVDDTEAEGPGVRCAVWLQGCPMRCPGCCNPEMLPFAGGADVSVDAIVARMQQRPVEGITLLGGEPFAQAEEAAKLGEAVRALGASVMVFTGYTLGELSAMNDDAVTRLIATCDLLVDGRYESERPEGTRRWIGSDNQRMHFLSDRYRPDDPCFVAPNTVEVRLRKGELSVNGWPELARSFRRDVKKR